MKAALYLNDCGVITPLGNGKEANAAALFSGDAHGFSKQAGFSHAPANVGMIGTALPPLPDDFSAYDSRNNRCLALVLNEIRPAIDAAIKKYGAERIAVVLGTSTSGIDRGEAAYAYYKAEQQWPKGYDYKQQEASSPSEFVTRFLELAGPAYTVATACSSSAKVFASARRLIEAGIVDAAIVGGADTLCRMTVNGFASLEILSPTHAKPFSTNRDGITIGEGAAVFLLSKDVGPVTLLGIGETADAHHITAPDPQGKGAKASMQAALDNAGLEAGDIAYINLHGTATPMNDAAESYAVHALFGSATPCSSTKGMTGHMLGAAGGCEAAFLWLALNPMINPGWLPPHMWDGNADPALPTLNMVVKGTKLPAKESLAMLSNSFGFGGSNVSLILGRRE